MTKFRSILILILLHSCISVHASGADTLQMELERYINDCGADVGVAVITDCADTIAVNNDIHYPMNSVMKLHQAMAVIDKADRYGIPLDSIIEIKHVDLHADTWSPMRDHYNADQDNHCIYIPLYRIMEYSLQHSDNNACDILFDRIAGISDTDNYIRTLGIGEFAIGANERMMHQDTALVAENWTEPVAAAALIHTLFTCELYSANYQSFILNTLTGCATGMKRLPAPLPSDVTIGHKTGTGFDDSEGHPSGINDVGFIRLPDGRNYAIAVFIKRCRTDMDGAERIISDISEIVMSSIVNNN